MATNLKEKSILVIDNGLFIEFALKLADSFGKVYYYVEWKDAYPGMAKAVVGTEWVNGKQLDTFDGKNFERVENLYDYLDKIDMVFFPDVYDGDMAQFLLDKGIPVAGSMKGEELELERWDTKQYFKKLGMDVQPIQRIIGLEALDKYLQGTKDKWVKISKYRKHFETFHHVKYNLTKPLLEKIQKDMGPMAMIAEFIVEDNIEAEVEEGIDIYTVDGKFPNYAFAGAEIKDMAFAGKFFRYSDLSEGIKEVNEQVSPLLKKYGYRGFFSTEVRTTKDKKHYFIDPCCFSDDTEVLTDNGWKLFKDCVVEDMFATLNTSTQEIEYHHATNYIAYKHEGKMIHLSNRKGGFDCLVTPNHEILRYDRHKENLFKERADSLSDKGYIPRSGKWIGIEEEFFELPEYKKEWDFHGQTGNLICTKVKEDKAVKIKSKDWAAFMGWYLSEGSTDKYNVNISQTKYVNEIEEVLKRLPFKYRKEKNGFRISSIQLRNYLHQFGRCNNKFVPDYIKSSTPGVIEEFLHNFNLGDGSNKDGKRSYFTTSKRLADDIQELILKIGKVANITTNNTKGTSCTINNITYLRNHDSYTIYENSQTEYWFETGNRKSLYINEVDYDSMVYCITVPNNTVFVRRNGKPTWSGNCRLGSPPSELYQEMYTNLGDIVWNLGQGKLVDPIPANRYGMEVMIHGDGTIDSHQAVYFPPEIRKYIKLRNTLKIDGKYYVLNLHGLPEVGAIVVTGSTLEECKKKLEELAKLVEGYGMSVKVESLTEAVEEFNKIDSKKS